MAEGASVARWAGYVAAAGGAAIVLAPLGYRVGVPLPVALLALAAGVLLTALAGLTGLVAAVRAGTGAVSRPTAVAFAVAIVVAIAPLWSLVRAGGAPPIHDITTDFMAPPEFRVARRHQVPGRADYEGEPVAVQQRSAYPDIAPAIVPIAPDVAFRRALAAARAMGWELLATDVEGRRLEASDRTFWFGFVDDIAVRVRPDGEGSRVDVRSLSRVGVGDAGANARRVREYLRRLADVP